ncbi:MAG: NADH-quinone oxidoreductase subunit C [Salinivirgaceae bacterium]|nr:MAG: NADH-quinone oxidoreductase subunit C [Salinivirgaceae bacterium]
MDKIIKDLTSRFKVTDYIQQRPNMAYVTVQKELAISLITHMRDIEGFTHFVLLTAVDWIEDNLFQLTYILNSPDKKVDLGIRVMIDRENPTMDSAHHLWQQVATYQRELKEMFGIDFPGSPRVDESFILEGWDDIPPYRRDFDTLKYAEETYFPRDGRGSNDPAEYMKKKLYPDEEK